MSKQRRVSQQKKAMMNAVDSKSFLPYKSQPEIALEDPDQHIFRFTPTHGTSYSQIILTPSSETQRQEQAQEQQMMFGEYQQSLPETTQNGTLRYGEGVAHGAGQDCYNQGHGERAAAESIVGIKTSVQSERSRGIQSSTESVKVSEDDTAIRVARSTSRRKQGPQTLNPQHDSGGRVTNSSTELHLVGMYTTTQSQLAKPMQLLSKQQVPIKPQQLRKLSHKQTRQQSAERARSKQKKSRAELYRLHSQNQLQQQQQQMQVQLFQNPQLHHQSTHPHQISVHALTGQTKYSNASTCSLSPRPKSKRMSSMKQRKPHNNNNQHPSRKRPRDGPNRAKSHSRYQTTHAVSTVLNNAYVANAASDKISDAAITSRPSLNQATANDYNTMLISPHTTQNRAVNRNEIKVNSAQIRSVGMNSPLQQTQVGKHRNQSKLAATQNRVTSDLKFIQAMAGANPSKCQSALMLHSTNVNKSQQNHQGALSKQEHRRGQISSKHVRNKTPSARDVRENVNRMPANLNTYGSAAYGNSLTQSVVKLNQAKSGAVPKGSFASNSGNMNSKRNELANYLSKILSQQKKAANANNYDQAQQLLPLHTHHNAVSIHQQSLNPELNLRAASGKHVGVLSKQQLATMSSQLSSSNINFANPATLMKLQNHPPQPSNKAAKKHLGGVILLNDHQRCLSKNDFSSQTLKKGPKLAGKKLDGRQSQQTLISNAVKKQSDSVDLQHYATNLPSSRKRFERMDNTVPAGLISGPSHSSMLLLNEQQLMMNAKKAVQQKARHVPHKNNQPDLQQKKAMKTQQIKKIPSELVLQHLNSNQYQLANQMKMAIDAKRDAMDYLDQAVRLQSRNSIKQATFGKSNSARHMTLKTTPKDDLLPTAEHTILNIRATHRHSDYDLDQISQRLLKNAATSASNKSRPVSPGECIRVEYHSDRVRQSHQDDYFMRQQSDSDDRDNVYGSKKVGSAKKPPHPKPVSLAPISKIDIGIQTSLVAEQTKVANTEVSSNREDKNQKPPTGLFFDPADQIELQIWTREKEALENYSAFFIQQLEPLTRNLLIQVESQPFALASAAQQMDIFGLRHQQAFSKDELKDTLSAMLFYKVSTSLIMCFQKLAKFAAEHFQLLERTSQNEMRDKENFLVEVKAHVRQQQKELFIRGEKLHLSEQMKKLKEKEITNLKNKISNMAEQLEKLAKEHGRQIQKLKSEQEANFIKYSRELKHLYTQNKDLIDLNKALRVDNKEQDERVRKIVNAVRKYPNLVRELENQLDETEQSRPMNNFTVTNSSHSRTIGYAEAEDSLSQWENRSTNKVRKGVVLVGRNQVAIPKFDMKVLHKYTKMNIEGKLPEIIETDKFDPEKCKQQVKNMLKGILDTDIPKNELFKSSTDDSIPRSPAYLYIKGGQKVTPISPYQGQERSKEQLRKLQTFQDSRSDVSGGERKHNAVSKVPSVKRNPSPYFLSSQDNDTPHLIQEVQQKLSEQQQENFNQSQEDSNLSKYGVKTPLQVKHQDSNSLAPERRFRNSNLGFLQQVDGQTSKTSHLFDDKQHHIATLQNQLYQQLVSQKISSDEHIAIPPLQKPQSQLLQHNQLQKPYTFTLSSPDLLSLQQQLALQKSQSDLQSRVASSKQSPFILSWHQQHYPTNLDKIPEYNLEPAALAGVKAQQQLIQRQNYRQQQKHLQEQNLEYFDQQMQHQLVDQNQLLAILQQSSSLQQTTSNGMVPDNTTSLQQTQTQNAVDAELVQSVSHMMNQRHQSQYGLQPIGATLQEQISKQYSPISKRLESNGYISHFSKSLAAEDLSKTGCASMPPAKSALARHSAHATNGFEAIGEEMGFAGLTSIEHKHSNGVTNHDEDMTQKRFNVEPSYVVNGEEDEEGEEGLGSQIGLSGQLNQVNYDRQECAEEYENLRQRQVSQQLNDEDDDEGFVYNGEMDDEIENQLLEVGRRLHQEQQQLQQEIMMKGDFDREATEFSESAPVFDPDSVIRHMHHYSGSQTHKQELLTNKKDYEFDGGHVSDAPLDISRVDDNFDSESAHSNQQLHDESSDLLENQNFAQCPYEGFDAEY